MLKRRAVVEISISALGLVLLAGGFAWGDQGTPRATMSPSWRA